MKCFERYIGIALNCSTFESLSGKYLTDLAGVSLQNIDAVANAEQLSFIGVFADVEKRAISRISKDILAFLKNQYDLKKVRETLVTNGNIEESIASTNQERGINYYVNYCYSELIGIHVSKVSLYALEEQDTTVKIYSDDIELYSKSITTSVGWNEINVNQSFNSTNIDIVYSDTDFTSVPNYKLDNYVCGCIDECITINQSGVVLDSRHTSNNTFGIKAEVSLRCLHESIICANVDVYSDAYLYALGVELMRERLFSDRVNRFTTVDKKKAQELLDLFNEDYFSFLKTANETISIKDDYCIECLEVVGTKFVMP